MLQRTAKPHIKYCQVTDLLYRLSGCEQHDLLDPSQEGFRCLCFTQRQLQSLPLEIEEAASGQCSAARHLSGQPE